MDERTPGPGSDDHDRDPLWRGTAQEADDAFADVADRALEALLRQQPDEATALGDHRFDDRLPDPSHAGAGAVAADVHALLADLDALDDLALSHENAVDLEILRGRLSAAAFEAETLRRRTWDPLLWNPGTACYLLLARPFAPLPERLESLRGRMAAVPGFLADARATLGDMPRVHVETAIGQLAGTAALLGDEVDQAIAEAGAEVDADGLRQVRDRAAAAVREHQAWLSDRLEESDRDPRLGPELYAAALWHTMDEPLGPDDLLARAEADLDLATASIESLAARFLGIASAGPDEVRAALDRCADSAPVTDATVLDQCRTAFDRLARFTSDEDIVTVLDDPVEIVEMPEIHRGVAVAYCDPPGPLETSALPTFFAVAPTPSDWDEARVRSFYREYNGHALTNLSVHEGIPGHVLQLAHSRRAAPATPVRTAWWSGPFVEGWAVYAERVVVEHGYDGGGGRAGALALALQRTKMALRTTINAILDVRVHARDMQEDEAMRLMIDRGFQEEGEAVGKWRRALLTHAQLSTYYVGYTEVSRLSADLAAARPAWSERERHDAMLSFGGPGPRHLRALLDLPT
jgi:uncharacterized protein (DUF885 family)